MAFSQFFNIRNGSQILAVLWFEKVSANQSPQRSRFNTSPVHVGFCGGSSGSGTGFFFVYVEFPPSLSNHQWSILINSIITNTKYHAKNNRPIRCVCMNSTPQLSRHFVYRQESLNLTTVLLSGCTLFMCLIYLWMSSDNVSNDVWQWICVRVSGSRHSLILILSLNLSACVR